MHILGGHWPQICGFGTGKTQHNGTAFEVGMSRVWKQLEHGLKHY
jgi:hypothetical protein